MLDSKLFGGKRILSGKSEILILDNKPLQMLNYYNRYIFISIVYVHRIT